MSQPEIFGDVDAAAIAASGHRLLLASAGTGKTFQLANHFAALLVGGAEPDRILATTFTRKAAGEILDRVLARLGEGALEGDGGESARRFIRAALPEGHPLRSDVDAARCRAVLARLVKRIDRFQVRTLDSFFVRLARAFAAELDLRSDWRVVGEVEERLVRSEAIARVLGDLEPEPRRELIRAIVASGESRKAASAVDDAVSKRADGMSLAPPEAWERVGPIEGPYDEDIPEAVRVVRSLTVPLTGSGTPNQTWEKWLPPLQESLEGVEDLASIGEVARALFKQFGATAIKNVRAWDAEGRIEPSPKLARVEIPVEAADALLLIERAVIVWSVLDVIGRNAAMRSLLERYDESERALRAETGAYRFSDFADSLLRGPAGADPDVWRSDLAYRIDGSIEHLLLDEFQDTSPVQWRLVEPLAGEILGASDGRTLFCVGDVKQSIYGWRGGDPRLLSDLPERWPQLPAEALVKSYRSSPVVLDAVNGVFGSILARPAITRPDRVAAREATERWIEGFDAHESARADLAGEARVWRARPHDGASGEKEGDPSVQLAVERVRAHHDAHPGASIGVLVRAKSNVPRLRYLLKRAGIESSDEGGNPLTDSAAVALVLALLHLADHPGDGVAALQVARGEWPEPFRLEVSEVGAARSWRTRAGAVARAVRAALMSEGFGGFCAARARDLESRVDAWDARRLDQLVEVAMGFDEGASLRPIDFASHVREQTVPDPTASRVKVMTIHASKGLEFDVVVLPELFKKIDLTNQGVLASTPDPYEPPEVLTVAPGKDLLAHHPLLRRVHEENQQSTMVDALSGLYVGMTRAVHALEMVLPARPAKGNIDALKYSNLVEEAFGATDARPAAAEPDDRKASEADRADLVWEHPDSTAAWQVEGDGGDEAFAWEGPLDLAPGAAPAAALAPSSVGRFDPGPDAAEAGDRPRRLGLLVHAMLAGIEWLEPDALEPGASLLDDAAFARALRSEQAAPGPLADEARARVEAALRDPRLAALLTRPGPGVRALRERSFDVEIADLDGGPRRVRGVLDRVHAKIEDGAVTRVTVVEFKTGDAAESAAGVAAAAAPQVALYRAALERIFALPPDAVTARLVWLPSAGGVEVREIG